MEIKIILALFLFMLIKAEDIPTIDLLSPLKSGEGDGYTIEEDNIYIKSYSNRYVGYIYDSYFYQNTNNRFILTGTNVDKTIIIQSTSFIYLDSVTLTSKGTTIIIEENCQVEFILRGKSNLINSAVNDNMGNIYLKEGAKLKIYGQGILNLIVNKFFGLYSESNSSLEILEGTLKIISTENSVGGIYIGGDIYFSNNNFYYEALSGENPVIATNGTLIIKSGNFNIVSNGTIFNSKNSLIIKSGNFNIVSNGTIFNSKNSLIINSGNFNITSEYGKYAINIGKSIYIKGGNLNIFSSNGIGIHAEESIYFGIKDEDNNNLRINLTTFDKGLEAQRIEIFSGNISIKSENDGIGILKDYCNENPFDNVTCYIKIYEGEILINSEKNGINSVGNIYVAGGKTIIYAGKNYHTIIESKLLKITKGIFFAGGFNDFKENIIETPQTFLVYNKTLLANSVISILDVNNLNADIKLKKDIDYFYINYPSKYELKIDEYRKETNIRILMSSAPPDDIEKSNNINLTPENEKPNQNEKNSQNNINNVNTYNKEIIETIDTNKNNIKESTFSTDAETEQIPKKESTFVPDSNTRNEKPTTNLIGNVNTASNFNSEKSEEKLIPNLPSSNTEEIKKGENLNNNEESENLSSFLKVKNLYILFMILKMLFDI